METLIPPNILKYVANDECKILYNLKCLRKMGVCCNAVLATEDGSMFYVHKAIMSSCSPYFRTIFTTSLGETKTNESISDQGRSFVIIPNVSSDMLEIMINYAYSGKTMVTIDNVNELLPAVDQFNIIGMIETCKAFIAENLAPENCLGVWKFGSEYFMPDLAEKARRYALKNFDSLMMNSEEFMNLSVVSLKMILMDGDLNVLSENYVWMAIKFWCHYKYPDRLFHIPFLFECVRLALLPIEQFEAIMDEPLVFKNIQCRKYITIVAQYILNKRVDIHRLDEKILSLFTPRLPQSVLLCVGGWGTHGPTDMIEVYDCRVDSWKTIDVVGTIGPRVYHQSIAVGTRIYVLGGSDGHLCCSSCFCFNTDTKEYQEIAPMLERRCYLSAALLCDKIYAIGGYNGTDRLRSVECFDIKGNQWAHVAPMYCPRSDASCSSLRNRIFVVGGFTGAVFLGSVECYYSQFNQWFLLPEMLTCRSGVGSTIYDNCIFAIGGFDGFKRLKTVEKFDLNHQQWFPTKSMKFPRSNFAVQVLEDKIYVMGGYDDETRAVTDACECFDPIKPKWKEVAPISVARSGLSVCVVSGLHNMRDYIRDDKSRCLLKSTIDGAADNHENNPTDV